MGFSARRPSKMRRGSGTQRKVFKQLSLLKLRDAWSLPRKAGQNAGQKSACVNPIRKRFLPDDERLGSDPTCLISSLLKKVFEPAVASAVRNYSSPKANKKRCSSSLLSSKSRHETVLSR
jgi:hypothetical protein